MDTGHRTQDTGGNIVRTRTGSDRGLQSVQRRSADYVMQRTGSQAARKNHNIPQQDAMILSAYHNANIGTQDCVRKILRLDPFSNEQQETVTEFAEITRMLDFAMKVDDRRTICRVRRALGMTTKTK